MAYLKPLTLLSIYINLIKEWLYHAELTILTRTSQRANLLSIDKDISSKKRHLNFCSVQVEETIPDDL